MLLCRYEHVLFLCCVDDVKSEVNTSQAVICLGSVWFSSVCLEGGGSGELADPLAAVLHQGTAPVSGGRLVRASHHLGAMPGPHTSLRFPARLINIIIKRPVSILTHVTVLQKGTTAIPGKEGLNHPLGDFQNRKESGH